MSEAAHSGSTARNILLRFGFLIVFAGFFLLFALWNPVFLQGGNLMNIIEGSAILMIVALGMTLIVATGGIDLSIGIALDFGAAFAVVAMKTYDAGWLGAVCAGVIGGSLVGLFNAALVVGLRISPFLATSARFSSVLPCSGFSPMGAGQSRIGGCRRNSGISPLVMFSVSPPKC